MKVIYGINNIKKFKNPVVALGVFDGVHLGHIKILKEAVRKAREIKGTSVVLTFSPHPQKQESIYSLEHRLRLIRQQGIGACIVISFNHKFSRITAEDFIERILVRKICCRYIYIGKNFRFGRGAKGNLKTLTKFSKIHNFSVRPFKVIKINNQPVSSTYIRKLIKKGKLLAAEKLLTRPVSVLGTVIKGDFLGRKLGFPTANVNPQHEVIPPQGIYAARVIFGRKIFQGACYIGTRPTFKSKNKKQNIEVYILDFKKNIYGKYLEIQFIKKIRNDRKFSSSSSLIEQIKKDIIKAKSLLLLHSRIPQYMPPRDSLIH